jgi:hypothetical protein
MKADEAQLTCFGAGVETASIVEKGVWDDLFLLEGGGHVRMKLQFVLSEDERDRIRMMVLFPFPNSHFNEYVYGQSVLSYDVLLGIVHVCFSMWEYLLLQLFSMCFYIFCRELLH